MRVQHALLIAVLWCTPLLAEGPSDVTAQPIDLRQNCPLLLQSGLTAPRFLRAIEAADGLRPLGSAWEEIDDFFADTMVQRVARNPSLQIALYEAERRPLPLMDLMRGITVPVEDSIGLSLRRAYVPPLFGDMTVEEVLDPSSGTYQPRHYADQAPDLRILRFPRLRHILKVIFREMGAFTGQGIGPGQLLVPALVYEMPDGRLVPILPGEEPPAGAAPMESLMDDRTLAAFLAMGFVPIGELSSSLGGDRSRGSTKFASHPVTFHDFNHVAPLLRDKSWMTALRSAAQRMMAASGPGASFNDETHALMVAAFEFAEKVSLPDDLTPAQLGLLDESELREGVPAFTLTQRFFRLREGNPRGFEDLRRQAVGVATRILEDPSLYLPLGGAAADPFYALAPGSDNKSPLVSLLLQAQSDRHPETLAQLVSGLIALSQITPEMWARDFMTLSPRRDAGALRILCESGAFSGGGKVTPLNAVCAQRPSAERGGR